MATPAKRRPENITGDFFVDSTCIDCDTCRWMAPETFTEIKEQSAVFQQPSSAEQKSKAAQALLSCPTASIGYLGKDLDLKQTQTEFPLLIEEDVYHCGYHSKDSYGAASYLIKRAEGNILVDCPRFSLPLVKRLEELGGIKYIFLSHRDDVCDHQKYHDHFKAPRIIHKLELCKSIPEAEILIEHNHDEQLTDDLLIISVPGHSHGDLALLYREKFLFSGDHLAYSPELKNLYAFKGYNWNSWEVQIQSVSKLANYNWSWLLPGHGRRAHASPEQMKLNIKKCVEWMQSTTSKP